MSFSYDQNANNVFKLLISVVNFMTVERKSVGIFKQKFNHRDD